MKTSYEALLHVFWNCHDPTQLNRQGPDIGSQYRSVIFYHDEARKEAALASRDTCQAMLAMPIVTEIMPAAAFYPAEEYNLKFHRF